MKVPLGTRIESDLRQRLRIYVAVTGRTVEDVVSEAIDGYLSKAARNADASTGNCLLTEQTREWSQGHSENTSAAPAR